ncbi:MAG: amidohydrolase family protein [Ilumatobacteraceae bacterium]
MGDVTAGMVNAHHHLYSALARGMSGPATPPSSFPEMLEGVWWRLDAALDADAIYWSAKLGAVEALMGGTTCIIDHHESPRCIDGSLELIHRACDEVGVRVCTAYGATDRWADDGTLRRTVAPGEPMTRGAARGLAECERAARAGLRTMVGLHAAFTCSDETLAAAAELARRLGVGVHVHVAEAVDDAAAGARLEPHAAEDWLLVHCVHLDRHLPGRVAHNPRSNMKNAVGYARPTTRRNRVVLGSDGIGSDMMEEARLAFARLCESEPHASATTVGEWVEASRDAFPESRADRVTWTYDHADDPWRTAYTTGMRALRVEVDGEKVLEDGRPTRVDVDEVRAKAAIAARALHARMEERR